MSKKVNLIEKIGTPLYIPVTIINLYTRDRIDNVVNNLFQEAPYITDIKIEEVELGNLDNDGVYAITELSIYEEDIEIIGQTFSYLLKDDFTTFKNLSKEETLVMWIVVGALEDLLIDYLEEFYTETYTNSHIVNNYHKITLFENNEELYQKFLQILSECKHKSLKRSDLFTQYLVYNNFTLEEKVKKLVEYIKEINE